jgi:hypothetical protein
MPDSAPIALVEHPAQPVTGTRTLPIRQARSLWAHGRAREKHKTIARARKCNTPGLKLMYLLSQRIVPDLHEGPDNVGQDCLISRADRDVAGHAGDNVLALAKVGAVGGEPYAVEHLAL